VTIPRPIEPVQYLFVRVIWDAHSISFPLKMPLANIKEVHVAPEPSHPFGRKGLVLASAWKQATDGRPDITGMLIVDGDVLIDPHDWIMMRQAIQLEPGAVNIAPAKLWPVSLDALPGWAWGHCKNGNFTQEPTDDPDFFAFNFTYLPRKLMELCIQKGLKGWAFPNVDTNVSRVARQANIPMRVVKDCHPKHMHY
jgi:hypothetical protein